MQLISATFQQKVEQTSKFQEHLELMQLKDHLLMSHLKTPFPAPPGLEDQHKMWPPRRLLNDTEDMIEDMIMKLVDSDKDDVTTDPGSDREGDSSEDEFQFKLSANAPEFVFTKLPAQAAVFEPAPKLSAHAPAFNPKSLRTGLTSNAKLFVPGTTKTSLNSDAELFVPQTACAAPKTAKPVTLNSKTKLALLSNKSELFVPAWPELSASAEMKRKEAN